MQNQASPHSVIRVTEDNHTNGGSSFSHHPARFPEFIRPLDLESHINNAVPEGPEPHGAGDQGLPENVPLIIDHHQVSYKELLRKKGFEIAGVLVSTLFLLFTLTVKSLKEMKPRFKIAGVLLILPLWNFALGFLIFVFGRFICVCVVGGAAFLLCHQMPHIVYIILHSNQTATGTFLWGALVYNFLEQLILLANCHIGAIPMVHCQLVTVAFTLFAIYQGGKILFQTIRNLIYLNLFNKKMKDVLFRLFMLEALLGPPLTDERRTELADEAKGKSKKSSRTTTVEYSTSKLLTHDEGRILLANIDAFIEFQSGRSQTDILQQASRAFNRIIDIGKHGYIDVARFFTREEIVMFMDAQLMPAGFGTGEINQSTFLEWAVEAYRRWKSLYYAIIDTKRMLSYLPYILFTAAAVTVTVALHAKEKIIVYFASFFILGHFSLHTAKTIFSSIFFVFVAHPFDVGDCCVIDGDQMIVEEINILYTVFLPFDKVKVSHPNWQLLSKPISNCSKNPDMSLRIEFSIDFSTRPETIAQLRTRFEVHLRSKPEHWQAECKLLMLGVEESKMKMTLNVRHNMSYQNIPEMAIRKSQLLTDMMKICQELNIRNFVIPPSD